MTVDLSFDVLEFLFDLLGRQVVQVGADDFDSVTAIASKAKFELRQAIGLSQIKSLTKTEE